MKKRNTTGKSKNITIFNYVECVWYILRRRVEDG